MNSRANHGLTMPPAPQAMPWPLVVVAAATLLGLAYLSSGFDLAIADRHRGRALPGDVYRIVRMSEIFAHGFGVAVVCVGVFVLAPLLRRCVFRLVLCASLPAVFVSLIKMNVARLRPTSFRDFDHSLVFPDSIESTWSSVLGNPAIGDATNPYYLNSFPSAHAATVVGFAVGMSWLFPRGRWLFLTLAVLGSYQRIQSQAHWTSDVLVGAAIGLLVAGLIAQPSGLGRSLAQFESLPGNGKSTEAAEIT